MVLEEATDRQTEFRNMVYELNQNGEDEPRVQGGYDVFLQGDDTVYKAPASLAINCDPDGLKKLKSYHDCLDMMVERIKPKKRRPIFDQGEDEVERAAIERAKMMSMKEKFNYEGSGPFYLSN